MTASRSGQGEDEGTAGSQGDGSTGFSPARPATPGRYSYQIEGTSSLGPLSTTAQYVVYQPVENQQQATFVTARESTETRLLFDGPSFLLTRLKIVSSYLEAEFLPNPPVLALGSVAPSQEWTWRMTSVDGSAIAEARLRMGGEENVDIGGKKVSTQVLITDLTVRKGSLILSNRGKQWVSRQHGLAVKRLDAARVTSDGRSEESNSTSTLNSLEPASF